MGIESAEVPEQEIFRRGTKLTPDTSNHVVETRALGRFKYLINLALGTADAENYSANTYLGFYELSNEAENKVLIAQTLSSDQSFHMLDPQTGKELTKESYADFRFLSLEDGTNVLIAQTRRAAPKTFHLIDPQTGEVLTKNSLQNMRVEEGRLVGDGVTHTHTLDPRTGEVLSSAPKS